MVKIHHVPSPQTDRQTSLGEAGAIQAVACLIGGRCQRTGKAAVGEQRAVGGAPCTGPVAGKGPVVLLRCWAPPIHHGSYKQQPQWNEFTILTHFILATERVCAFTELQLTAEFILYVLKRHTFISVWCSTYYQQTTGPIWVGNNIKKFINIC